MVKLLVIVVVVEVQVKLGRSAGARGCPHNPRGVRSWTKGGFMNCKDGVLLGFLVKVLVLFGFCGAFGGCAGSTSAGGRVRVRSGLQGDLLIAFFYF